MKRTKSLTIKSIKIYKGITVGLITAIFLSYFVMNLMDRGLFGLLLAGSYVIIMIFIWFPSIKSFISKLKEVSYDDDHLYVKEGDYEIQIPFHQIKDIEIISMDGLYKFKLYHNDQFGDEVICKPSIWYPLNYKKIDKELNRIRSMVRKAHMNYKEQINATNTLASFN